MQMLEAMRYHQDPTRRPKLGGLLCGHSHAAQVRATEQHGHGAPAPCALGARNHPSEPDDLSSYRHPTDPASAQTSGFYFQFCTLTTEQHVSFCSGNKFFQISPYLRLPLFSILGNNRKTKVNLISTGILLQETTPKELMCSPTQQEKPTLHRDRKRSKVGWTFLFGLSLRVFCIQSC